MKRPSKKQITKDQFEDEDEDEGEVEATSKTSILNRKTKKPVRKLSESNSIFGSNSLGASGSTSTSLFSKTGSLFGTTGSTPSFGTTGSTSSFGTTGSTPSFGTTGSTSSFGVVPSATLSFGTTGSNLSFETKGTGSSFPTTSFPSSTEPSDSFLKNARGLNHSFLSHIKHCIEKDPFCDLSSFLEEYKNYRSKIEKENNNNKSVSSNLFNITPSFTTSNAFPKKDEPKETVSFASTNIPSASASASASASSSTANVLPLGSFQPSKNSEEKKVEPSSNSLFGNSSLSFGQPPFSTSTFGTSSFGASSFGTSFGASNFGSTTGSPFGQSSAQGDEEDGGEGDEQIDDGGVRTNTHLIKKGPGEEEEDSIFELEKVKLFNFDQSSNEWKDIGVGFLKINVHQVSKKKRVLSRADGSGRELLNVGLIPQTQVTHSGKKDVILVTVGMKKEKDEGKAAVLKYLIRVKDVETATKLYSEIQKLL